MADPIQFSDVRTMVQFLTQDTRTDSTTQTDRDNCINNAYITLAGIRGFWRKRSTTITLTAGTVAYNAPDGFSDIYRLYYRQSGLYYEVEVVNDARWLEVSATDTADAGTPRYARVTQTSATQNQIELTPPPSSSFISSNSTLTLEYFIEITRLTAATDELILPANLRHAVAYVAAYEYALGQGDFNLADRLKILAEEWKARVLKHDLTRTGKGRHLYPARGYWPDDARINYDYGQVR